MTNQQIAVLEFIARNPGCTAADVTRYEWGGRGHRATYDRVKRLRRNGALIEGKPRDGRGIGLYVAG